MENSLLNLSVHQKRFDFEQASLFLFLWILVSLPFSVMEWNPGLVYFNRAMLLIVGVWAFFLMSGSKFKKHIFAFPYVLVLLLLYFVYGGIRASNIFDFFHEVVISGGAAIICLSVAALSTKFKRDINLPKYVSLILLMYSLDVLFQAITGVNVFGIEPYGVRNWGFFVYGAPSAGVFIAMLFFVPWFWLTGTKRVVMYAIVISAMIVANDRAPVAQILAAIFFYLIFIRREYIRTITSLVACFLAFYVLFHLNLVPSRVHLLFESFFYLLQSKHGIAEVIQDSSLAASFSVHGYIEKWASIYSHWFVLSNWFNVMFGTGIGIAPVILSEYTGGVVGRPHSNILEVIITFGLVPFAYFVAMFISFVRQYKSLSIVVLPALLPFSFYSIYSFNWFFLFIMSLVVAIQLKRRECNFLPS